MVLASVILTCIGLGTFGGLAPTVRAATAAEAPNPQYVEGTVVAEPGAGPPLVQRLRSLAIRIILLALLASAGVGLMTWALLDRRQRGATRGQDR